MGSCCGSKVRPKVGVVATNHNQDVSIHNSKHIRSLPEIETYPINDTAENSTRQSYSSSDQRTSEDSKKNIVNVLLLGESGVGKSTFINALVNYLAYDTLEQARLKRPLALMPASFLITTGHQFEERIVRFGQEDPNENHNNIGQSVTQHCRSYVFTIGTRTKLRLIDTPGMGDTRGHEQDDRNIHHILSFINNLSHLNAICILLKPNESKLNVVFRSYFTRLIGFLGEHARQNIIFCFTNTRSTFFAPGDTGPRLRQMLKDLPIKHIPFNKANTFCFDSESFRYLMAVENGIEFDEYQRNEYEQSWVASVNESNRFIQYIACNLNSYPQNLWRSIEHAQLQILKLIRPILESIRNIHRNMILISENSITTRIELRLIPLQQSSTLCTKCNHHLQQYSAFWIVCDDVHVFADECNKCQCAQKTHIDVYYELKHENRADTNGRSINAMEYVLDELIKVCIEFGCFFLSSHETSESIDPILSYLNHMIEEEDEICQNIDKQCLNNKLYKKLNQFQEDYEHKRSDLMSQRKSFDLTTIYKLIQQVYEMDLMKKQMNSLSFK